MNILREKQRLTDMLHLARQGFGEYKKQIILLIGMGFLSGVLEGIGINAIIPLFSFVSGSGDMPTDIISRVIERFFVLLNVDYRMEYLLVFIIVLFLLKAVALFFSKYISAKIQAQYIYDTRSKLYRETLYTDWRYLSKQKIGYLEKILLNDINAGAALLGHMSAAAILITNSAVYIAISFNISTPITLLTLVLGALMFLLFKPFVHKTKVVSQQSADIMKQCAHHINESIIGMKTIKAEHLEKNAFERGKAYFESLKNIIVKLAFIENVTYTSVQPLSMIVILTIFAVSYKSPDFSFASFVVIVYAINKIFVFVQSGQSKLNQAMAQYPFLRAALKYEEDAIKNKESSGGNISFSFKKQISLNNVSFSYNKSGNTLSNITAQINRGEITGIIGPSGSGKTTLVDLLLRLIKPTEGTITIDGTPIEDIKLSDWRTHVGYVSQDVFLINDTIENNIKLYDQSMTDTDLTEAAKAAHIYDFVMTLPKKFNTIVGERGMELSGGQRQRIALARVLARKPSVLILDEATSALDNESQALIQKSIENLRGDITIIIIAHRPSTIANADKLLVLKDEKVVECGSPQKLIKDKSSYYHMISNDIKHT